MDLPACVQHAARFQVLWAGNWYICGEAGQNSHSLYLNFNFQSYLNAILNVNTTSVAYNQRYTTVPLCLIND